MLKTTLRWELLRIRHAAPGAAGLLALLFFPLLFLLPWQRTGLFPGSFEADLLLTSLYVFMLAGNLGSDSGTFDKTAMWLFQKGVDLADYGIARLVVLTGIGACFVLFAMGFAALGMGVYRDFHMRALLVCAGVAAMLFIILLALYFVLGALGANRKSEIILLLVIMAFAQDILLRSWTGAVRRAAHAALPPFQDAFGVNSAIANADWAAAFAALLHSFIYLCACMGLASLLQRRWRPRPHS